MKTIEGALKPHLSGEGCVSASHMEGCHDPPCQWKPLNPDTGCVQWILGKAWQRQEFTQHHRNLGCLEPYKAGQGDNTAPVRRETRWVCKMHKKILQDWEDTSYIRKETIGVGGMGWGGRGIQDPNDDNLWLKRGLDQIIRWCSWKVS